MFKEEDANKPTPIRPIDEQEKSLEEALQAVKEDMARKVLDAQFMKQAVEKNKHELAQIHALIAQQTANAAAKLPVASSSGSPKPVASSSSSPGTKQTTLDGYLGPKKGLLNNPHSY